tara:strand:+ start:35 stop:493 length:459 start_codon:yes stop_codon:yes gene_type:complete
MATRKKVNLDQSRTLDIEVRKGNSWSLVVTFKNSSGTALALTTLDYRWSMAVCPFNSSSSSYNSDGTSLKNAILVTPDSDIKVKSATPNMEAISVDNSGNVTLAASDTVMSEVKSGQYTYYLQYKDVSTTPDTVKTVLKGNFLINSDDLSAV